MYMKHSPQVLVRGGWWGGAEYEEKRKTSTAQRVSAFL